MSRLPPLSPEDMTPDQAKAHDEIVSGPRGSIAGPLSIWVRVPALARQAQKLGAYCRFETALRADLRELAILVTGKHHRAGFEWWAHERIALDVGLAPEIIAAVKEDGELPDIPEVRIVHRFCTELVRDNRVTENTYRSAEAMLGSDQLIEIVGIVGYYALICHTINAFEISVPPDEKNPFPF